MGASAGTLRGGDLVQQLLCHSCGATWMAAAASGGSPNTGSRWSCSRCTLSNEQSFPFCAACHMPRRAIAEQPACRSCGGEFVERIGVDVARVPQPDTVPAAHFSVQELLSNMTVAEDVGSGHAFPGGGSPDSTMLSMALALSLARQYEESSAAPKDDAAAAARQDAGPPDAGPALKRESSAEDPELARMDAYEKEKRLGMGAHGCAILVRRKKDGMRLVAKQIAVPDLCEQDQIAAMREVDVMRALSHPNVIKLHKSFLEDGYLYIIMEHAPGGDLAAFLKQAQRSGPLSQGRVVEIARQVLAGLEHMHERRLLHRDLKPANVFLSSAGEAKLGDFGVSRVLSHTLSQARTMIGTPYYLSPEMIDGKGYSFPSDVWSAGVLIYECLTFSHPFQGANLPNLMLNIMRGCRKPLPACYDAGMQELVTSMMCPEPERRPSASDCLAKLVFQSAADSPTGRQGGREGDSGGEEEEEEEDVFCRDKPP